MFSSVGWGEILVIAFAGLFILGPERLPGAAARLGRTVRLSKEYISGAQEQIRSELGPEFDELRKPLGELGQLRGRDPRRALFDVLTRMEGTPDAHPEVTDVPAPAPRPR